MQAEQHAQSPRLKKQMVPASVEGPTIQASNAEATLSR